MAGGGLGALIRAGRRETIPPELRALPQWVLYRVQTRGDKATKVPYQAAHAGRRASATDPATWSTFDAAVAALDRGRGNGIGFVFTAGDPFTGIDLDACLRGGVIVPEAVPLVERLSSYTEESPGGNGLHVIGRGEVGGGRRTSKTPWGGELEVYDRERYFTITGRHYANTPTAVLDLVELDAVRAEFLPEDPPPATPLRAVEGPARLDDRDLLERAFAARNGPKFRALWQGDTSGYKSASEADAALCRLLAFWTGPDPDRIDWLFRQSGLMRVKWDREEYRTATITKVLAGARDFYGDRPPQLRALATPENALEVASAAIKMTGVPLVEVRENHGGRLVLDRADGLRMAAPSLESLATFAKLSGALVAGFGHELSVPKDEKVATAHRFVAALRRHLGQGKVDALEERFEGWMIELARLAREVTFEAGDAEGRLRAWQALDEHEPEAAQGGPGFAKAVILAHDLTTGDRYLRASWAQEYVRRSGWKGSLADAVGGLEAIGLEQPNPKSGGQVRARWRAGGETLTLRFWIIPATRFDQWRT